MILGSRRGFAKSESRGRSSIDSRCRGTLARNYLARATPYGTPNKAGHTCARTPGSPSPCPRAARLPSARRTARLLAAETRTSKSFSTATILCSWDSHPLRTSLTYTLLFQPAGRFRVTHVWIYSGSGSDSCNAPVGGKTVELDIAFKHSRNLAFPLNEGPKPKSCQTHRKLLPHK